ncbi:hypothetical protein [Psychrobacter sp. B29-1]|nr:hypothetical protein [Psychrobacter sp. B29-1]
MNDYKSPQEMEALALELLEIELNLDMPAKTCPICGSNVETDNG